MSNTRGDLVAKINKASSLSEQARLVADLDAYDQAQRRTAAEAREIDLAGHVVAATLSPVRVHEMHTASTDWIADFEAPVEGNFHQASIAEAAMWFGRTSAEVKADAEEFGVQAEGFMQRQASQYGEQAEQVKQAGLEYLGFLWRREAASGLDQVQQTVDPHENPKATPLNPEVFDNFADEVHPINQGVVGTETSERTPLLQEIEGQGGGQGAPEVAGGHSVGNEAPTAPGAEQMAMQASYYDVPSVAIAQTYTMDDFRRQAASGLDEVQQVVNPHEDPAPTPLPTDVAFPWLLGEDAYGNGGGQEKPKQAAARQSVAGLCPTCHGTRRQPGDPGFSLCEDCGGTGQGDMSEDSRRRYDKQTHGAWDPEHPTPGVDQCGYCGQPGRGDGLCEAHGYMGDADHRYREDDDRARETNEWRGHEGSRKQADMFGNSDQAHAVPQPGVANSPATTPNPAAGAAEGRADALAGDRPTFADNSSAAPANVQAYSEAYGETAQGLGGQPNVPTSLQQAASKVSDRFVKAAAKTNQDFLKAYAFAAKWAPGKPLVTVGNPEFESGLFAGLADHPGKQAAWAAAHQRQARKDPQFATRMQVHAHYTAHLASQGIDVTAATSTDLDTMAPYSSPQPNGQTPINGPGTVPPLAGQEDAAAPGGPAPYNGAQPFGTPVVPTGAPAAPSAGVPTVNDVPGGPLDGNTSPATLAFRRQVQANLLADKNKKG